MGEGKKGKSGDPGPLGGKESGHRGPKEQPGPLCDPTGEKKKKMKGHSFRKREKKKKGSRLARRKERKKLRPQREKKKKKSGEEMSLFFTGNWKKKGRAYPFIPGKKKGAVIGGAQEKKKKGRVLGASSRKKMR